MAKMGPSVLYGILRTWNGYVNKELCEGLIARKELCGVQAAIYTYQ